MANGAPILKDRRIDAALKAAEQQQQAQQQLAAILNHALQSPTVTRRACTCLPVLAWQDQTPVLMVALPSGERWEVPLTLQAAKGIAQAIIDGAPQLSPELAAA